MWIYQSTAILSMLLITDQTSSLYEVRLIIEHNLESNNKILFLNKYINTMRLKLFRIPVKSLNDIF